MSVARTNFKQPNLSVNLDLFKDLDAAYFLKITNSWQKTLTEVNFDIMRVIDHPDAKNFRGFAFPPQNISRRGDE
jgi:hypothetical protein